MSFLIATAANKFTRHGQKFILLLTFIFIFIGCTQFQDADSSPDLIVKPSVPVPTNPTVGTLSSTSNVLAIEAYEIGDARASQPDMGHGDLEQTSVDGSISNLSTTVKISLTNSSIVSPQPPLVSPLISQDELGGTSLDAFLNQHITITQRITVAPPTASENSEEATAEAAIKDTTTLGEILGISDTLLTAEPISTSVSITSANFIPLALIPAVPDESSLAAETLAGEAGEVREAEEAGGQDREILEIRTDRTVNLPILMYHYLSVPPADADIYRLDLSVTPDQFSRHLDGMLDNGYTTVNLQDLWNYLYKGVELPPKPVIITFDDGYLDNYTNAFPLLLQRGMTATFFVVTDFIEHERPRYISWDMAREMFAAGMSIESHGINHYSLKNRDSEFLVFQALRTKEMIEARIGNSPKFVSYPAGEYDKKTIDIFQSAGYLLGVTTIQGGSHDSNHPFELRRVRVRGTTTTDDLLRLLELDW